MYAEPKDCLEDVAIAQWEEASVITACGNNSQHKLDFLAKPKSRLIGATLRACRMLEVYAEPKDCLEDVGMAHWEEASVITACGNNSQHELVFLAKPKPRLIEATLRACRMLEVYAEPKDCLEDVVMAQ